MDDTPSHPARDPLTFCHPKSRRQAFQLPDHLPSLPSRLGVHGHRKFSRNAGWIRSVIEQGERIRPRQRRGRDLLRDPGRCGGKKYFHTRHAPTVAHPKAPPFSHSGDQVSAKTPVFSSFMLSALNFAKRGHVCVV